MCIYICVNNIYIYCNEISVYIYIYATYYIILLPSQHCFVQHVIGRQQGLSWIFLNHFSWLSSSPWSSWLGITLNYSAFQEPQTDFSFTWFTCTKTWCSANNRHDSSCAWSRTRTTIHPSASPVPMHARCESLARFQVPYSAILNASERNR